MCEQVYKTYSGGVCDEAIALGHEENFGKVLDVYEKILGSRKVSNPTMIGISSISYYVNVNVIWYMIFLFMSPDIVLFLQGVEIFAMS